MSDFVFPGIELRYGLMATPSFWNASQETRLKNCNGCGTSGWKGLLVPDTLYGLSISFACDIHDWCYGEWTTFDCKTKADMAFQQNMLTLIHQNADKCLMGKILRIPRELRSVKYYLAVLGSQESFIAFRQATLVQ